MKEKILNITIGIMSVNAILQLALSQIHISAITSLFVPEIGFYLFGVILMALVTLFNLTSIKKSSNEILLVICSLIATVVGIIYTRMLLNDYNTHASITFEDIKYSLYLVIISTVIIFFGTIIVVVTKKQIQKMGK